MKKFIIYILSILGIIIISLYILDLIYTYSHFYGLPRNKVSYIMQKENDTINYIFIGSSRVDNTINADIISSITGKSAINLGFQGAGIDDYLIILQLLNQQNIKAEHVFIQIDYVYNMKGNSEILKSNLMPYIHNQSISQLIKNRDKEYYQLKYIPFYRYLKYDYKIGFREFFNLTIGRKPIVNLKNGYFPKHGSDGQKLEFSLPQHIISKNEKIKTINNYCKKNNISLTYFMAPFCPNTHNSDFSNKLSKKLPSLLDYSQIFQENKYFYNCGHLNNLGATKFSQKLAKDILELEEYN